MATKADKSQALLPPSARARIVNAFDDAYNSVAVSGAVATKSLCSVLRETIPTGAKEIAQQDLDAITSGVASKRGWKRDTLKSRKTEIKAITLASHSLYRAADKFAGETGACGWHNVVGLARFINAGKSPDAAVSALKSKMNKKSKGIETASEAKGYVAQLLKRALKAPKLPSDLRKAILELAVDQRLNVGATA